MKAVFCFCFLFVFFFSFCHVGISVYVCRFVFAVPYQHFVGIFSRFIRIAFSFSFRQFFFWFCFFSYFFIVRERTSNTAYLNVGSVIITSIVKTLQAGSSQPSFRFSSENFKTREKFNKNCNSSIMGPSAFVRGFT